MTEKELKKLQDGEHREYDENRVLRKIFHTKNGQLDGEYKEYNDKGEVTFSEEYRDGVLRKRFTHTRKLEDGDVPEISSLMSRRDKKYEPGDGLSKEETYDDAGVLQSRKIRYSIHVERLSKLQYYSYSENTEFKDGVEYNGHKTLSYYNDEMNIRYEKRLVNGKRDGRWFWEGQVGDERVEIDADYKLGVPWGEISEKREKDNGEHYKISGYYDYKGNGLFTGTVIKGNKARGVIEKFNDGHKVSEESFIQGTLKSALLRTLEYGERKYICKKTFYPNGMLKSECRAGIECSFDENGKNMIQKQEDKTVECEVRKVDNDYIKDGAYKEINTAGLC